MTPMQLSRLLARISAIVVLLLTLAACGAFVSKPTTFYTLTTLEAEEVDTVALGTAKRMTVAVGPVEIVDYLARPEIVVRSSANTLKFAASERWGGSLRNIVNRTLIDNLALLLGPTGYRIVSWETPVPADYRMAFSVSRFERNESGKVILEADWQFFAEGGTRIVALGSSRVVESVNGESYSATVETMGRALAILSRELAAKIQELPVMADPVAEE
jgi:uncharacterized lipoprotein YmbA